MSGNALCAHRGIGFAGILATGLDGQGRPEIHVGRQQEEKEEVEEGKEEEDNEEEERRQEK